MNILALGASCSSTSINRRFAAYTSTLFDQAANVDVLDLNDFDLPLFNVDLEAAIACPEAIGRFLEKLQWADFIILSMSEHNGSFTAVFKNLLDWTSRVKRTMFDNKPVLLLSTSPGPRGGAGSLQAGQDLIERLGAKVIHRFSLPRFEKNFDEAMGIKDPALNQEYQAVLRNVKQQLGVISI